MTNSERIEAYFNNELPEAEKEQLLQDMDTDASLKSEFQFQEEIINGIKAYRKEQLIARLDNIQIATTGQSLLLKTIGVVGIATVATIGTYIWLGTTDKQVDQSENSTTTEIIVNQPQEAIETPVDEKAVPEDAEKIEPSSATTTTKNQKEKVIRKKTEKATPSVIVPQVQEPDEDVAITTDEDLTSPDAMATSAVRLNSNTDVEIKMSKKYNFHYQIKDGTLILYGQFNDAPFEVIEMKTNNGIKSYLFYKENFYGLNTDSEDIKPLLTINNEALIKELNKRR